MASTPSGPSFGFLAIQHDWDEVVREVASGSLGSAAADAPLEPRPQPFVLTNGETIFLQPQPPPTPEFWVSGHSRGIDAFGKCEVVLAGPEAPDRLPVAVRPKLDEDAQPAEAGAQASVEELGNEPRPSAADDNRKFTARLARLEPSPAVYLGCAEVLPADLPEVLFQAPLRRIDHLFASPPEADGKQQDEAGAVPAPVSAAAVSVAEAAEDSPGGPGVGPLPDLDHNQGAAAAARQQQQQHPRQKQRTRQLDEVKERPVAAGSDNDDAKGHGHDDDDDDDEDDIMSMSMAGQVSADERKGDGGNGMIDDEVVDQLSLDQLEDEVFQASAAARRRQEAALEAAEATCFDVRGDGRQAIVGGADGALTLVDLATGRTELRLCGGDLRWEAHAGDLRVVKYLPNPVLAVSAGIDTQIKLWALDIRGCALTLRGVHQRPVTDLAIVGAGAQMVSVSLDGTGCLWETGRAQGLLRLGIPGVHDLPGGAPGGEGDFSRCPFEMRSCAMQADGLVWAGCDNGWVYGYDPRAGELASQGATAGPTQLCMPVVKVLARPAEAAAAATPAATVSPAAPGNEPESEVGDAEEIEARGSVNCLALLDGGAGPGQLVAGLDDGSCRLLDIRQPRQAVSSTLLGRNRNVSVSALGVAPRAGSGGSSPSLLVGSELGDVSVWNRQAATEDWVWSRELTGGDLEPVAGLAALEDGRVFSLCGSVIREYDL